MSVRKSRRDLACGRIAKAKIIRLALVIPILLAHALPDPLKAPEMSIKNDRCRFDQIEVNRTELSDERASISVEWAAALFRKPHFCLGQSSVSPDKFHDGRRIVEPVRVMFATGLCDEGDATSQFAVPLGDNACVLIPRDDFIGITIDVQERHLRSRERCEVINRILVVGPCFGVRLESIVFEHEPPVAITALAFAKSPRPTPEIANRRICINASGPIRIRRRPIVHIQATAT